MSKECPVLNMYAQLSLDPAAELTVVANCQMRCVNNGRRETSGRGVTQDEAWSEGVVFIRSSHKRNCPQLKDLNQLR